MTKDEFVSALQAEAAGFNAAVSTDDGEWIVKGFIDIARRIYTISMDTKVISKIMELLLFPDLCRFAETYGLKMVLAAHQNHYPDISFVDADGHRFALDVKSTYRVSETRIREGGMTLGAYTGYFRQRDSAKNATFPYGSYLVHVVLGVIYSRTEGEVDERRVYRLEELADITSVVRDFVFFAQEKYRIASDQPGSSNTRNIGSVADIGTLVEGRGPFADLGEEVFDDYWMFYLNRDMARLAELPRPPYRNLQQYLAQRGRSR